MIQLAIAVALTTLQVKDVDVWFVPNIDVTDHSPFDHTPNGTYDARDVFGGTFGSVPHEWGHVVFEDDSGGTGQPDFIEWTTKAPVSINRILFTWQDDSPGNNWRNLSRFRIFGRRTVGDAWQVIWQDNTGNQVGHYTIEKKVSVEGFQDFRAEFIRGPSTNITANGPRIVELEAYGHNISG